MMTQTTRHDIQRPVYDTLSIILCIHLVFFSPGRNLLCAIKIKKYFLISLILGGEIDKNLKNFNSE